MTGPTPVVLFPGTVFPQFVLRGRLINVTFGFHLMDFSRPLFQLAPDLFALVDVSLVIPLAVRTVEMRAIAIGLAPTGVVSVGVGPVGPIFRRPVPGATNETNFQDGAASGAGDDFIGGTTPSLGAQYDQVSL